MAITDYEIWAQRLVEIKQKFSAVWYSISDETAIKIVWILDGDILDNDQRFEEFIEFGLTLYILGINGEEEIEQDFSILDHESWDKEKTKRWLTTRGGLLVSWSDYKDSEDSQYEERIKNLFKILFQHFDALNMSDLARKVGIWHQTLSQIPKHKRPLSLKTFKKIQEKL